MQTQMLSEPPHPLSPCLGHAHALVSDWYCQQRTSIARREGRLPEEEAAICLACPRGGAQAPRRYRTYMQARADRAAARKAALPAVLTPNSGRARCCLRHQREMKFCCNVWYCSACTAESNRALNERRRKGQQKEDAMKK